MIAPGAAKAIQEALAERGARPDQLAVRWGTPEAHKAAKRPSEDLKAPRK